MEDETVSELEHDNQCSIGFDRNAKGEYSWKIKSYHQPGDELEAIARIRNVNALLLRYEAELKAAKA